MLPLSLHLSTYKYNCFRNIDKNRELYEVTVRLILPVCQSIILMESLFDSQNYKRLLCDSKRMMYYEDIASSKFSLYLIYFYRVLKNLKVASYRNLHRLFAINCGSGLLIMGRFSHIWTPLPSIKLLPCVLLIFLNFISIFKVLIGIFNIHRTLLKRTLLSVIY